MLALKVKENCAGKRNAENKRDYPID